MPQHPIIAIIPQDLAQDVANDPSFAHIRTPITVEHSPYECPGCNRACWIGPKQKLMAILGGMPVACVHCIADAGGFEASPKVIGVNLGIEDVQRRFGPS